MLKGVWLSLGSSWTVESFLLAGSILTSGGLNNYYSYIVLELLGSKNLFNISALELANVWLFKFALSSDCDSDNFDVMIEGRFLDFFDEDDDNGI